MSGRTRGHKAEEENEEDREDAVSPAFSYFSVSSSPSQAAPESPSSSRQASKVWWQDATLFVYFFILFITYIHSFKAFSGNK
jgi:hypothetical protein